jgi:TRAP-type C4-dicarboxylate transport system permease small subunit
VSRRSARILFSAFLIAYTVFLTWPGMEVANRATPRILGLPLSFFWVVLWVASAFFVLLVLHLAENREREEGDDS